MAINKALRMAMKVLSVPDVDLTKTYKLHRTLTGVKAIDLALPIYRLWDRKIDVGEREIKVRVYTPKNPRPDKSFLFFHGGGWATESVDTYNKVCLNLAKYTSVRVISAEYRLAPENPFPLGLSDCYEVAKQLFNREQCNDVPTGEIILIGDSAGGNLCAAVSLMARDKGDFKVSKQILLYPATYNDHSVNSKFISIIENGFDYVLTSKKICEYMKLYATKDEDFQNPYFAPLLAESFENQPDTLVITAQFDPLRDEGEAYGKALYGGGNYVEIYRVKDAIHGFFSLGAHSTRMKRVFELINKFIDR